MGIKTTTMEIGNLASEHVRSLVAEALRMEGNEDSIDSLAATIHKKTEGNALRFFYLQYLMFSVYKSEISELTLRGELVPHTLYSLDILVTDLFSELSNMNINGSISNNNTCSPNAF